MASLNQSLSHASATQFLYRTEQTSLFPPPKIPSIDDFLEAAIRTSRGTELPEFLAETLGDKNMLGLIALVLIVLWLLGFLAFHVSSGLIHILLVIGLIMLVFHFLWGSPRTA